MRPNLLLPLAQTLAVLMTSPASGADRWWDGGAVDLPGNGNGATAGGAGTWNTSIKNWDQGNNIAYGPWNNSGSDIARFGGSAGTVGLGTDDLNVAGIVFSTNGYTVNGNGRNLAISGTGTTITARPGTSIGGFATITLAGSQAWTSSSSGSYSIDLTVSGGTVQTNGHTLTLAKNSNGYVAVTSLITGSGGVSVTGDGISSAKYHFGNNPANTFTGITTLNGFVRIDNSLGNAGVPSVFGASISTDPAQIQLNSGGVMANTSGTTDRGMTLNGNCGFWAKGSANLTLGGRLTGTGGLSAYGDISNSGKVILATANDFSGTLGTGNDGRLQLAHPDAAAKATLNTTLGARAGIDLTTHNLAYVFGGITGSGNLNLGTGLGGSGDGFISIGSNDQSTSHTGVLSGSGGLRKTGTGTLSLGGANTYGGGTFVQNGVLAVNGNALPDNDKLVITGGKVAATGEELVDTLWFGSVRQAAGTWGANGSGADHIDDTRFTGTSGVIRVKPWAADPESLDFAQVAVGHSVTLDVVITNLGTTPINGTASTDAAPFSVGSSAWSVQPSSSTSVQVVFSPVSENTFSGTLTLTGGGLTRIVQLTGEGLPLSPPVPTQFRDYESSILSAMPAPAASANLTLTQGASTTQGFIPRRDAFLTAYAAREATAPAVCRLATISVRTANYTNTPSTLRFEVFRVENDSSRTLLGSGDFQRTVFGNTTYTFTLANPPDLAYDANHELKLTVITAGNPSYGGPSNLTFFRTAGDYSDGALDTGGDLWCEMTALAPLPVFSGYAVTAGAGSRFFLDADPANADSSNHDALPGKLLGVAGETEPVVFTHPAGWGPLTFEIDTPGVATGSGTGTTGTTDTFTLAGQAEGRRMLWVRAGSTVVGWMKLQVYPRRSMNLSYTYVAFPSESDHALKTMNASIMAYISGVYDKANVGIHWTDNGTIIHEWDLDGDGQSHEEDYSEVWSPLDSGALPNPLSVFTNVYMLRYDKIDATERGNGGGTSRGLGEIPPPANLAMVRCTLNRSAASLGSTLSHEIGHNLGLWHTDITNNLMDVGRAQDTLWTWQWDIVHNTLAQMPALPTNPDENSNGLPDAWEDHWFGSHDDGENPADGDPDFDGLVNLMEFATGTNPTASNPSPVTRDFVMDAGNPYLQIAVPRNPDASTYTFVAEFTTDFQTWTPGVMISNDPEFIARDTIPTGTAPGRRFGRVSVSSN